MTRWIGWSRFGVVELLGVSLVLAPGIVQAGSFDELSPGNQRIANALFSGQKTDGTTTPLTLDEIAAQKQGGRGWGEVFKDMKSKGLLEQKNLGQAVSDYNHQTKPGATGATGGKDGTKSTTSGGLGNSGFGSTVSPGSSGAGQGNAFGHGKAK